MAICKTARGNFANLDAVEKHDGWIYFCTDYATMFFDYTDANGNLQRKQLNAKEAETLGSHTAEEFLLKEEIDQAYSSDSTNAQSGIAVAEAVEHIKNAYIEPIKEETKRVQSDIGSLGGNRNQLNTMIYLLVEILKSGVYTSDQTANLNALKAMSFDSDIPEEGIVQVGDNLQIFGDVIVSQIGSNLEISSYGNIETDDIVLTGSNLNIIGGVTVSQNDANLTIA